MNPAFQPKEIYEYLSRKVIGQDEVLRTISVAVYTHIHSLKGANVLLIGNSGTGKTTIMKSIQRFYMEHPELQHFSAMAIMNANSLVDEHGDVRVRQMFKTMEESIRILLRREPTEEELRQYMGNATVSFDEVDKIPSRIGGKPNVRGIAIQQALLTILEGEKYVYETRIEENGRQKTVHIPLDTANLLFICGGAFEDLYDHIYSLIVNNKDQRKLKEETYYDADGKMRRSFRLELKKLLRLDDLFGTGYQPQFISRFGAIAVLEDLKKEQLKRILLLAEDSPLALARAYFASLGIRLEVADDALDVLAQQAAQTHRIGARALREEFNRVVDPFKFDPYSSTLLRREGDAATLVLDKATVVEGLIRK